MGLSVASTAALFATHHGWRTQSGDVSLVSGWSGRVRSPALTGLLPSILDDTQLVAGNALLRLSNNIASLIGPAIAALVIATAGVPAALFIDAGSFIVSIFFVSGIKLTTPIPSGFSMFTDLRHGWRAFIANQWVWVVGRGLYGLQRRFRGVFSVLGPIVMKAHFDGARGWAVVTTTMAVGSIFGAGLSMRLRPRRPMLVGISAVSPLVVFILALAAPLPLFAIALLGLAYATGSDIFGVQWESGLQRHIEPHLIVGSLRTIGWVHSSRRRSGLSVTGLLADHLGVEATIVGGGGSLRFSLVAMLATPSGPSDEVPP